MWLITAETLMVNLRDPGATRLILTNVGSIVTYLFVNNAGGRRWGKISKGQSASLSREGNANIGTVSILTNTDSRLLGAFLMKAWKNWPIIAEILAQPPLDLGATLPVATNVGRTVTYHNADNARLQCSDWTTTGQPVSRDRAENVRYGTLSIPTDTSSPPRKASLTKAWMKWLIFAETRIVSLKDPGVTQLILLSVGSTATSLYVQIANVPTWGKNTKELEV